MKTKTNSFLNKDDYIRIWMTISKWPVWMKQYANEHLLISKNSQKLPVFVEDDKKSKLKCR